jgi:hypothetical protein
METTHLKRSSSVTRCLDMRRSCEKAELATLLRDISYGVIGAAIQFGGGRCKGMKRGMKRA